ncbi:MAG TPA: hypothetical protein VFT14_04850 [Solirubrobacterales bacterium]|nr:hypothetical protein [Solirubrobacterales bacterium]
MAKNVGLDAWEIYVDACDFCEETADTVWVTMEGKPRLVRACLEHAERLKMPVFAEIPATCGLTDPGSGPNRVPCGAAVTHIILMGIYQDDEPQVALVSSCRRHATPPDEQA